MNDSQYFSGLHTTVQTALGEDIGSGDITAELIPATDAATATVICRETAVICGRPWVDEVFRQLDPALAPQWQVSEGSLCRPDDIIFTITGKARTLLTGERTALNFLQTLSATATAARHYQSLVAGTELHILDTRKTLPGLRLAQKYAVASGGCKNHRLGLYDAFLIKENHIAAAGGIKAAIEAARALHPDKPVEIEVEDLAQYAVALDARADIIMLDNFPLHMLEEAVKHRADHLHSHCKLEASGGYQEEDLKNVAATGVDYISIGALTKHCRAVDFSMRLT